MRVILLLPHPFDMIAALLLVPVLLATGAAEEMWVRLKGEGRRGRTSRRGRRH